MGFFREICEIPSNVSKARVSFTQTAQLPKHWRHSIQISSWLGDSTLSTNHIYAHQCLGESFKVCLQNYFQIWFVCVTSLRKSIKCLSYTWQRAKMGASRDCLLCEPLRWIKEVVNEGKFGQHSMKTNLSWDFVWSKFSKKEYTITRHEILKYMYVISKPSSLGINTWVLLALKYSQMV